MKPLFVLLSLALTVNSVSALTIDSDTYFAHASSNDRTIVLSHRPCENPEFSKYGWKKAHYYFANGNGIPSCWKPFEGTRMDVCWMAPNFSQGLYNCMPANKNRFMNTSSLPSAAKF